MDVDWPRRSCGFAGATASDHQGVGRANGESTDHVQRRSHGRVALLPGRGTRRIGPDPLSGLTTCGYRGCRPLVIEKGLPEMFGKGSFSTGCPSVLLAQPRAAIVRPLFRSRAAHCVSADQTRRNGRERRFRALQSPSCRRNTSSHHALRPFCGSSRTDNHGADNLVTRHFAREELGGWVDGVGV